MYGVVKDAGAGEDARAVGAGYGTRYNIAVPPNKRRISSIRYWNKRI